MKTCPSCRAEVPPQVAVCPFCGARFADAPPRPLAATPVVAGLPPQEGEPDDALPPPRQDSHLLQLPPAPMVIMGGAPARRARRRRTGWLILPALLVVGLLAYGIRARGVALPVDGLEPILADEPVLCGDAPDCVVVYLAPWDDASEDTAALLPALRAAWGEDGPALEIVVGAGARDAVIRMARQAQGSSWIDAGDALPTALGFATVPTWLRVQNGRVIARVEGTWLPLDDQLEALGLPPQGIGAAEAPGERRILTGEPGRPALTPLADEPAEDEAAEPE